MDIQGLKALLPTVSGATSTTDKTSKTATGASAPAAVSPVVHPPAQPLATPGPAANIAAQLQAALQASGAPHQAQTTVQYSFDDKTGLPAFTVRDALSGQIIRQMPIEVAVRLLATISLGTGTLLDSKA